MAEFNHQTRTLLRNANASALALGEVVRITSNRAVARAQANSAAGVQGVMGVASIGAGIDFQLDIVTYGEALFLLEPGLTLVVGEALFVSPTIAGRCTNVEPASNVMQVGTIIDTTGYSDDSRVRGQVSSPRDPTVPTPPPPTPTPPSGAGASYFMDPTATYLWGAMNRYDLTWFNVNPVLGGVNGPDMMRAYYNVFPRKGTLLNVGFIPSSINGGAGGSALRWGIYSNAPFVVGQPNRPASLLFDSGPVTSWPDPAGGTVATQWRNLPVNLAIDANTLLWLVWMYNTAFQTNSQTIWVYGNDRDAGAMGYLNPTVLPDWGGVNYFPAVSNVPQRVGWRNPQVFASGLPATWTPGTQKILTVGSASSDLSAIWNGRTPAFQFNFQVDAP